MLFTSILESALLFTSLQVVASLGLNVTVISSQNDLARFECWQMSSPLVQSTQFGIIGTATTFLGDVTNITYNVIPSGFDSGIHNAPSNQWVIVLNGLVTVTLPDNSTASVTTTGGEQGLLFFKDTASISKGGHGSYYPGVTETIFLQIPVTNGDLPDHQVLFDDAPCSGNQFEGLRDLANAG
ncbi:hypothetical protein F4782DRAFT_518764 [Xylaria castorea]|nr:hypothetical protein F4782DRAFT_518764 [Xylaria castorea]